MNGERCTSDELQLVYDIDILAGKLKRILKAREEMSGNMWDKVQIRSSSDQGAWVESRNIKIVKSVYDMMLLELKDDEDKVLKELRELRRS